jgi:hypothetical protein
MLERFATILIRPERPGGTGSATQWRQVEEALGTALPSDYKEFVSQFGSGYIDRFLWILSPFERWDSRNLVWQLDEQRDIGRILRESLGYDMLPFGFYPQPGGLLPWAGTDDGDVLYWATKPADPDRWPVVLAYRDGDWEEIATTMTRFLEDLLTRRQTPFGGDDQSFPMSPLPLPYSRPWES